MQRIDTFGGTTSQRILSILFGFAKKKNTTHTLGVPSLADRNKVRRCMWMGKNVMRILSVVNEQFIHIYMCHSKRVIVSLAQSTRFCKLNASYIWLKRHMVSCRLFYTKHKLFAYSMFIFSSINIFMSYQ